jgi:hypothetical protein
VVMSFIVMELDKERHKKKYLLYFNHSDVLFVLILLLILIQDYAKGNTFILTLNSKISLFLYLDMHLSEWNNIKKLN